jgi:hypothetical protein
MRLPAPAAFLLLVLTGLATTTRSTVSAEDVSVSPAMAGRILERGAEVAEGFREMIQTNGDTGEFDLSGLGDTDSPDWRLYYRDRQLLFAMPTRRNVTAFEKKLGEDEARGLAAVMLQQKFSRLLDLDPSAALDEKSIRVVFIEPDAHRLRSDFIGFRGPPLPMYPFGYWPAGGTRHGGCGCR